MREEGKKEHKRVEEPLVLGAGVVNEVVLDSRILIAWTGKLCFFRVNTVLQRTSDKFIREELT